MVTGELEDRVRAVLEAHWREPGFTVPNARVYPWQWLWDSCFHAVIWAALGEGDRGRAELVSLFARQHATGFVPHLVYWDGFTGHASLWGRERTSSITQPPLYGHAVAELVRRGVDIPESVTEAASDGLRHLAHWRPRSAGLVPVVHPWETGCDDSPRWDRWLDGPWDADAWRVRKGDLVATIERSPGGAPSANAGFRVAPAGFNALVAWNARELASVTGEEALLALADELVDALEDRWDADLVTWTDPGDGADTSGRVRTADALLPLLVTRDPARAAAALAALVDEAGLGAPFGPRGVDRREPAHQPRTYWRGPAWPQLTYLLWLAARAHGAADVADRLGAALVGGAVTSGLAEYWDADDGTGLGAVPQSWAGLALVVAQG